MSVFGKNTSVIELTPINFKNGKINHKALEGNKKGMIIYSTNWCHFCKITKKPYQDTSFILGKSFPMFNLDCIKYSELASSLGINSYPTIKYIDINGKIIRDFTGERTVEGFLEDICKESRQCPKRK